jgi:hypothetical protein
MKISLFDLLNSNNYHTFNRKLAHEIGLNATILLSEIIDKFCFFEANGMLEDGWYYLTVEDVFERTTLAKDAQRGAIEILKAYGFIECKQKGMPAKRYFKVFKEKFTVSDNSDIKKEETREHDRDFSDNKIAGIPTTAPIYKNPKEDTPLNPPKGGKPSATPSAKAEELSAHFLQKIKEKNPNFIPKALKNWSSDFDRMLKKPGRSFEKAQEIIDWLVQDLKALSFVQSASKLDKDWDALEMRFEAGREKLTINANREWALSMKQVHPEQLKSLSFNDKLAINRAEDKVLSFALEHEEFKEKFIQMFGGRYV